MPIKKVFIKINVNSVLLVLGLIDIKNIIIN